MRISAAMQQDKVPMPPQAELDGDEATATDFDMSFKSIMQSWVAGMNVRPFGPTPHTCSITL